NESSFTLVSPTLNVNSALTLQNINNFLVPDPNPPRGFPAGTTVVYTGDARSLVASLFGPSHSLLDLRFHNAPAGFEGNNGLWLQADQVNIHFGSSLAGAEANFRYWANAGGPFEGIVGVRYLEHNEFFNLTTFDDRFPDFINTTPTTAAAIPVFTTGGIQSRRPGDPRVVATYGTEVRNRIVGPQLGLEGHLLPFNWLALSYSAKATLGANFITRDISLTRG